MQTVLDHPLPIYQHCTLREIAGLVLVMAGLSFSVLPLLSVMLSGSLFPGFLPALIVSLVGTRLLISWLGRLKQQHPYGYWQQRCRAQSVQWGFCQPVLLTREGVWTVGR